MLRLCSPLSACLAGGRSSAAGAARRQQLRVLHVRWQGNQVAHGFAKLGHDAASPRVWRDGGDAPPDEVLRYLQRDAEDEG